LGCSEPSKLPSSPSPSAHQRDTFSYGLCERARARVSSENNPLIATGLIFDEKEERKRKKKEKSDKQIQLRFGSAIMKRKIRDLYEFPALTST